MIRNAKDLPPIGKLEPTSESFIKVRRGQFDSQHPLHPLSRGEIACSGYAWLDLVAMAKYQNEYGLERGQLRASQGFLEQRWGWGNTKVRNFLDELESMGMITRKVQGGRLPTVIIIRPYDNYSGDNRV